ncbi:hypothetical protein A2U01_0033901 [Trifolium medium]|uniref:Uncharacterized protein n=1 Tax=Trifolium medium TaxID=97028 RepID=A0A392PLV5_9FABA|nr:hypothetical protein [Trifolium medium]
MKLQGGRGNSVIRVTMKSKVLILCLNPAITPNSILTTPGAVDRAHLRIFSCICAGLKAHHAGRN